VSSPGLFGWEHASFTWAGSGLYAQLVASWFYPLTLAAAYRAVEGSGRVWLASALLAATFLVHLIYGYMAAIALAALALPVFGDAFTSTRARRSLLRRCRRLAAIYGGTALLSAFFVIPFLLDREFVLHSRWEPQWKWDSHGFGAAWDILRAGDLLDAGSFSVAGARFGRPPVLAVLALLGLIVGRRSRPFVFLTATSLGWYLVSFGRPTWGSALSVLPFSSDLHLHRMVGPLQLFAPVAAGVGVTGTLQRLRRSSTATALGALARVAGAALLAAALASAVLERGATAEQARTWSARTRRALTERADLLASIDRLGSESAAGRLFAGRAQDFGKGFQIGDLPCYALLAGTRTPALSYLYMAMSPAADFLPLYDPWRLDHNEIFGVSRQIFPTSVAAPEFARVIDQGSDYRVLALPTSPWFSLVNVVANLAASSEEERYQACRHWLKSERPGRGELFRMMRRGGGGEKSVRAPRAAPGPPRGTIEQIEVEPGRWSAEIEVEQATHLLLKTTFHPGLEAELDGMPVPVEELSLHFAGVEVGPGRHRVVVRYRPRRWRAPLAGLGLVLFALGCGVEELRRRAISARSPSA